MLDIMTNKSGKKRRHLKADVLNSTTITFVDSHQLTNITR